MRRSSPTLSRSSSRCAGRCVLGLGDYVRKNGFGDVVVGVSGGIDSAVTAALAADTLGPERVHCVSMPSRYTSAGTREDARRLAESLGTPFLELEIEPVVGAFAQTLQPLFAGTESGLAEENVQARVRGTLLMALSNKFGWLVVATGNKSELSVGYATLYGDMVGGFALLKDVFKTDVFRLARHLNDRARARADPQLDHRATRRPPSCAPTSSTRTRSLRTPSSTASWRPTSRTTGRARSCPPTGSTASSSSGRWL